MAKIQKPLTDPIRFQDNDTIDTSHTEDWWNAEARTHQAGAPVGESSAVTAGGRGIKDMRHHGRAPLYFLMRQEYLCVALVGLDSMCVLPLCPVFFFYILFMCCACICVQRSEDPFVELVLSNGSQGRKTQVFGTGSK